VALLQGERGSTPVWQRLQRAMNRLIRASNSILWLSSPTLPQAYEPARIHEIVVGLVEELAPLAATKGQTLELDVQGELASGEITWPGARDAVEAVLANLLLNAIQHGSAGVIRVEIGPDAVSISNPFDSQAAAGGFGIGLQIVERLIERFGWERSRDIDMEAGAVQYTVHISGRGEGGRSTIEPRRATSTLPSP
jgi:signal transduction histidine kinase